MSDGPKFVVVWEEFGDCWGSWSKSKTFYHLVDATRFADKKRGRVYKLDNPLEYVVTIVDAEGGVVE